MASAQVLPNAAASTAKKKELLAAGKRRLEEFRRKKALEKGKNAASARQSRDAEDCHSPQTTEVQPVDSDEVGPWSRVGGTTDESLGWISSGSEPVEAVQNNGRASAVEVRSVAPLPSNKDSTSADEDSKFNVNWRHKLKEDCKVTESDKDIHEESGISNGQQMKHKVSEPDYPKSVSCGNERKSNEVDNYSSFSRPESSQNTAGSGNSFGNRKIGSSFNFLPSPVSTRSAISEPLPSSFESDSILTDHALVDSVKTNSSSRRSRPLVLDDINVSSPTPFPSPDGSVLNNKDISNFLLSNSTKEPKVVEAPISLGSSSADNSSGKSPVVNSSGKSPDVSISANYGSYQFTDLSNGNWNEHENSYRSAKQNEDFSALEQHIEDLTREKFSLQRAVEASRALAESLASENSALTDSYNQQGSVVNQLKFVMEKLQEEIRGQLVELEAVKSEYGNALLECNAADERAKLLASEVISLEEKALRLRSNELKLERQLETAVSESASLKKKISTLEIERQDLHASITAFQEEKKLLQSKLRKLSFNGTDKVNNSPSVNKNASTSTEDLDPCHVEATSRCKQVIVNEENATPAATVDSYDTFMSGAVSSSEINNQTSLSENIEVNLQVGSVSIPSDQMGVIQNIDALLSELALEKEELISRLRAESSECSKFKELNKELSKRLEIQTQRLELLTAQSMAGANVVKRQTEMTSVNNPVIYADEGDEVVERVLGWIMTLFPRGPSKRQTSKASLFDRPHPGRS